MADQTTRLIKETLSGDRSAYWKFLKLQYEPTLRIARHLLNSANRAEAVTHQIFLDFPFWLRSYRGQCPFEVFLYQLIENTCEGLPQGEARFTVDVSKTDAAQVRRILLSKATPNVTKGAEDKTIRAALAAFDKIDLSSNKRNLGSAISTFIPALIQLLTDRSFWKLTAVITVIALPLMLGARHLLQATNKNSVDESVAEEKLSLEQLRLGRERLENALNGDLYGKYLSDDAINSAIKVGTNYPGLWEYPNTLALSDWKLLQSELSKSSELFSTSVAPVRLNLKSYPTLRMALGQHKLPELDTIQVEDLINYFPYSYPPPTDETERFRISTSLFPTPWNERSRLLHIGIKGYHPLPATNRAANLVLLIDNSTLKRYDKGSSNVKDPIIKFLSDLTPDSSVAMVTFGENSQVVIPPTKIAEKEMILRSISALGSKHNDGSTQGLESAFALAKKQFIPNGVNRVTIISDGDFFGGIKDRNSLKELLRIEAAKGLPCSAIGIGVSLYRYQLQQILEKNGFESALFADTPSELRRALSELVSPSLATIAKNLQVSVDFSKDTVSSYRLIGYEARLTRAQELGKEIKTVKSSLPLEDLNVHAGHEFTALYELVLAEAEKEDVTNTDPQEQVSALPVNYARIRVSYEPLPSTSELTTTTTNPANAINPALKRAEIVADVASSPAQPLLADSQSDSHFVAAVAAFAQLLRQDSNLKNFKLEDAIKLAEASKGSDNFGYRAEFINLAKHTQKLLLNHSETAAEKAKALETPVPTKPTAPH